MHRPQGWSGSSHKVGQSGSCKAIGVSLFVSTWGFSLDVFWVPHPWSANLLRQ